MKTIWLTIILILIVLIGPACGSQPSQQVQAADSQSTPVAVPQTAEENNPSTDVEQVNNSQEDILLWEGPALFTEDQTECHRLRVTKENKAYLGLCDGQQTEVEFVSNQNGGLGDMVSHFAPFQADTPQGRLTFNGQGQITGPAWERAITSWAQFSHAELASGRVGATTRTALAWNVGEQEGQCQMLLVLGHGYATAGTALCQEGQMEVIASGWVETVAWEQLDEWLYNRAPFYQDNNYLDGRGTAEMSAQESSALAEWAKKVYVELTQTGSIDQDIPVALNLQQILAQQLHVNIDTVQIAAVEEKMWPDPCLGAPYVDEMCAQVETPGYRIVLAVNNQQYVYHTDLEGRQIRPVSLPEPEIGERILTWFGSDDSGCRTVEVGTGGVAFGRCGRALMGVSFSIDTRQADITEFAAKYASFEAETSVGMVNFAGHGPNVATPAEQRMVAEWAQLVYQEAEFGRSGASWGLILAWHREGGPSNFCDDVTVYSTGDVFVATSCQGTLPVDIGRIRLNAAELARMFEWVDTFQPFEYNPDPSTNEGVTIQLVFSGAGLQVPHEFDMGQIAEFAQNLQLEASMQAVTPPVVCPTPQTGEQLLLNEQSGYCLLYPAEYSLVQINPGATGVVKDSVMNHIDPRVSIDVESANGRTLQQAVEQIEANYGPSGLPIERSNMTVDGVAAIKFDNLPGQDINRRVIFIQNERLYSLFFSPIGDEGSPVRQQAEGLYRQVMDSFRLLEATAPTATPTPAPTPTSVPSGTVVLPSQVQYVMAVTDVNMRSGPGTNYPVIGSVFGGQIALVTGITADGRWWRVICPDSTVGSCFVIADPSLTQPTTAPGQKPTPTPVSSTGVAVIEAIEVNILESFPVQVQAVVQGYLPDACTFIEDVNALQQDFAFRIQLTTARQPNARCALQITPFSEVVSLSMRGLPAGQYRVSSNSVSTTFYWDGGEQVNTAPEGIFFASGSTLATVYGFSPPIEPKRYVLRAQGGQFMQVTLNVDNANAYIRY